MQATRALDDFHVPVPFAANWLGVAPQTLANWRSRKIGPAYVRIHHRLVVYRMSDLQEFMDALRTEAGRMPRPVHGRMPGGKNRPKATTIQASGRS